MTDRNRHEAAQALLEEIEAWCERTKSARTLIGKVLFEVPGFYSLLKLRLTVTTEKEAKVREFMTANPDGWVGEPPYPRRSHVRHLNTFDGFGMAEERERAIAARRVDRDPCQFCGVRPEVGCRHQRPAA
jgi:hypothetical protein